MSFVYCDLKVLNGALVLDTGGNPEYIYDRDVIAQDIKHRILESGILTSLIGERSTTTKDVAKNRLIIVVEQDTRIVSGSTSIDFNGDDLTITATTEFGTVNIEII